MTALLTQALRIAKMPEVRFHLRQALAHAEKPEKKKEPARPPSWFELVKGGVQNPLTPQRTLDVINQMLEQEKLKLQAEIPEQPLND